jgi:cardiolipin synthase
MGDPHLGWPSSKSFSLTWKPGGDRLSPKADGIFRGAMRLTANHVTLLRLALIPIPCALLLGGAVYKSLALVFFVLVGLTDFLDGYLARKQGPTTLGALIDPLADKIFVAAMFVPLAYQGSVPLWMVWLVFIREYAVTELRTIHGAKKINFRTSELAKYKTTIQMIGGGVIILNDIFGPNQWVFFPLGGLFLFTVWVAWQIRQRGVKAGLRALTFMVLVAWALAMRWQFPYEDASWAIMALVTSVTVMSGLHYGYHTWRLLGRELSLSSNWAEAAAFLGGTVIFPSIFLVAVGLPRVSIWLVLAVLASEMVIGGLNNLTATSNTPMRYAPGKVRLAVVNGAGLLGVIFMAVGTGERYTELGHLAFCVSLLASLAGCAKSLYIHRRTLMEIPAKAV